MKFGVQLGNYGTGYTGNQLLSLAQHVEELGFDSIWVSDHIVAPAHIQTSVPTGTRGRTFSTDIGELCLEAIVLLSAVAASTSNIRLGTSVLIPSQRNPVILAKQIATLDSLANGRIELGLGGGWLKEEYAALNGPFERRWKRLEESIQIFRLLWREREVSFSGETYAFGPVRMLPKPVSPGGPPITIGGRGPRALKIAGCYAEGLNASRLTPAEIMSALDTVRAHAQSAGRPPAAIKIMMRCDIPADSNLPFNPDEPWVLAGSADDVARTIRNYETNGVDELIISVTGGNEDRDRERLAWFSREAKPLAA